MGDSFDIGLLLVPDDSEWNTPSQIHHNTSKLLQDKRLHRHLHDLPVFTLLCYIIPKDKTENNTFFSYAFSDNQTKIRDNEYSAYMFIQKCHGINISGQVSNDCIPGQSVNAWNWTKLTILLFLALNDPWGSSLQNMRMHTGEWLSKIIGLKLKNYYLLVNVPCLLWFYLFNNVINCCPASLLHWPEPLRFTILFQIVCFILRYYDTIWYVCRYYVHCIVYWMFFHCFLPSKCISTCWT